MPIFFLIRQTQPAKVLTTTTISTNATGGGDIINAITGGTSDPWVLTIAFIGAVAGVTYRSIYPFLERAKEEESAGRNPIHFLSKYKFSMGISLLLSIVITMGGFDQLTRNLDETAALGTIFIISFTSAIGWNELTNRVSYKISDKIAENKAASTATSTTGTGTGTGTSTTASTPTPTPK